MYGMINKAVGEMVCGKFGEEAWEDIKAKAGCDIDVFISNDAYPDELTYRLVGAAAEKLGVSADAVLKEFGKHWILETARRGYAELMFASGRTLPEFLDNLPNFHTRVTMIFPNLEPPRFECTNVTATSLNLHYHSSRRGLTAFVFGLLDGLGEMFGTEVDVQLAESRAEGADHDVFLVRWAAPAT